jgi:hypothetical protein
MTQASGFGGSSALPMPDETVGGGGGAGGILPEDIQEMIDQATDDFRETVQQQQEQIGSAFEDINNRLNETELKYQSLQSERDAAMNDALVAEESRVLAALPSDPGLAVYEKAVITQNGQSQAVVKTVSGQNVDYTDNTLYGLDNQFAKVVSQSDQPIYGYGGADYNKSTSAQKADMGASIERLKTDEAYRKSEEARARQVIDAREAIGADTSSQEKFLGQIQTYREAASPSPAPAAIPKKSEPQPNIAPRREPPKVVGGQAPKPTTFREIGKSRVRKTS